ncbi:unnamed protein product [Scytosiphon promiscuus]
MESNGKAGEELRLEGSALSEASTWPSTPEQATPPPFATAGTAAPSPEGAAATATRTRMRRSRLPKRPRHETAVTRRWGLSRVSAYSSSLSSSIYEPGLIMKFSTMAAASGGLCLVVAVFSGPALVFLVVLAAGVCGMCYSVRQRGALEYLPSGVVELLTRTTLLEFLTDTSVFDAIKTYLVFMMGLSEDETQGVLASLPEDMRHTLTRPGMMHTLPRPFQEVLLPPNATPRAGLRTGSRQEVSGRGRRRLRVRTEGFQADSNGTGARAMEEDQERYDAEEREPPLGQLVWNPLPSRPAHDGLASNGRGAEGFDVEGDDPRVDAERRVDSEEEPQGDDEDEDEVDDEVRQRGRRRGRSTSFEEGDSRRADRADRVARGGVISHTNRRPWEEGPRPDAARSLSPVTVRDRARGRAVTDVGEADRDRTQSSVRTPPSYPARRRGPMGWAGRMSGNPGDGGILGSTPPNDMVPSAERLVASILQRRVDGAVKAAWNAVDERGVRRAALGSGIALAAHMALSERARRQASGMLRGSLLAALAATATVCAGLVYLKPGESGDVRERISSNATDRTDQGRASESEEKEGGGDVSGESLREGGEGRVSRPLKYRQGLRRWLTVVTPSTRNMVRLLGMICLLLALRKWQLVRRAALRATMPRSMYGATPS